MRNSLKSSRSGCNLRLKEIEGGFRSDFLEAFRKDMPAREERPSSKSRTSKKPKADYAISIVQDGSPGLSIQTKRSRRFWPKTRFRRQIGRGLCLHTNSCNVCETSCIF